MHQAGKTDDLRVLKGMANLRWGRMGASSVM